MARANPRSVGFVIHAVLPWQQVQMAGDSVCPTSRHVGMASVWLETRPRSLGVVESWTLERRARLCVCVAEKCQSQWASALLPIWSIAGALDDCVGMQVDGPVGGTRCWSIPKRKYAAEVVVLLINLGCSRYDWCRE